MTRQSLAGVALSAALIVAIGTFAIVYLSDNARASGQVILVAESGISAERLPFRQEDFDRLDVVQVSNQEALASATANDTLAVLVESGAVDRADWGWMQERFREGLVIGGININMADLLEHLRPASDALLDPNDGLGWATDSPRYPSDRLFYSVLIGSGQCLIGTTDFFDHGNQQLFASRLNQLIGCARASAEGLPYSTAEVGSATVESGE